MGWEKLTIESTGGTVEATGTLTPINFTGVDSDPVLDRLNPPLTIDSIEDNAGVEGVPTVSGKLVKSCILTFKISQGKFTIHKPQHSLVGGYPKAFVYDKDGNSLGNLTTFEVTSPGGFHLKWYAFPNEATHIKADFWYDFQDGTNGNTLQTVIDKSEALILKGHLTVYSSGTVEPVIFRKHVDDNSFPNKNVYGQCAPWLNVYNPNRQYFSDKYFRKKILFFGDSITNGSSSIANTYPQVIAEILGCYSVNRGVGGANGATVWNIVSGQNGYPTIDYSDSAAVCFMVGANGVGGSMADITGYSHYSEYPSSLYGDMGKCIEFIQEQNINTRIYLLTTCINSRDASQLQNIQTTMKALGNYYALPLIDVMANSGIGTKNTKLFHYDGLHPNELGYKKIGEFIAYQLNAF
jgi:lysophospholipase L1-like esterase